MTGHLSRIETGGYRPPSDEMVVGLAKALDADEMELLRLAGRERGRDAFEQRVLAELQAIERVLRTSRDAPQPSEASCERRIGAAGPTTRQPSYESFMLLL